MPADYRHYPFRKGRLPQGWVETTVGDVLLDIQSGFSSGKQNAVGKGIPHLRPMNVSPLGELSMEDVRYIWPEVADSRLKDADVLFTNTSSTAWVGKTALIRQPNDWAFSNHMTRLRVGTDMDPEFLARQLHYLCMCGYFAFHCKKHINQSSIGRKQLTEDVPFRCPPALEQKRITKKLARLLKAEQNVRDVLETLPPLMLEYREAVLKAACTGELVPIEAELASRAHRQYERASDLLRRVTAPARPHRFESRNLETMDTGHPALAIGKPRRPLPEGWAWTPLVEVAHVGTGHTPSRKHPEWWGGKIPWLGIVDAREKHGHIITKTSQTTNKRGLENSAARLLPKGTVCVSRTASVGYVVVLGRPMATSQDFVNWTPTKAVLSEWLKFVFMADRQALAAFGKGAIHTTIYFPEWLSMHIALPPIVEQERIVAEVQRKLAIMNSIAEEISGALEQSAQLRASLFQRAIAGELVSQNASDEPAISLLSRIHNERDRRAAETKSNKPRRKEPMKKLSAEQVKEAIQKISKDRFTFSDINVGLHADYNSLKGILFDMLAEPKPFLKQVFDTREREMRFHRTKS